MKQVAKKKPITQHTQKKKKINKKVSSQNSLPKTSSKKPLKTKVHHHPQYGTSKLEEDFAHDFLDKLGVEYQYQFEAKDIGRFYDFYLPKEHLLLEIDGDFWHANPDIYKDEDLKYHQKKARAIDEMKNKWALIHCIPIMRIWEHDIRNNPSEVMKTLKERLYIEDSKQVIEEGKNKHHVNKLKK